MDSGASVLIVDAVSFHDRGGELSAACPQLDILTLGQAQYGLDIVTLRHALGAATARDLSAPADLGTLNYTGGTTGRPKGVVRSNLATAQSALSIMTDFEIPLNPRYLAIAPISHVSGTNVLPTLMMGGTIHLLRRFDPEEMLATIEKEKINFSLLVPTMIYTLLDHPALDRSDLSSLELLLYGASPMSPSRLAEGLRRIGPVFSQLYGQSECYPIAVLPKSDHDMQRPELLAACGFPTASCLVTLRDENDQLVASDTPGEICVRAAHAMTEYWRQPDLTREAHAGGWLHTGDIARADEQGRLYIVDRKKDMIISGGFNVYPREVEDVLTAHPAVASAAVVGIADAKWGEAVQAVVVMRPGMEVSAQALIGLVKEQKGPLHAPKTVRFVQELPLTALGKIDKKALRQTG
jgi:fatty-acyl-CoA synthase